MYLDTIVDEMRMSVIYKDQGKNSQYFLLESYTYITSKKETATISIIGIYICLSNQTELIKSSKKSLPCLFFS